MSKLQARIDQAFSNEPATVQEYGFSTSKEKGTPCLWIEFVFDNFKDDGGLDVTVRADLYITDNTIDYVLEKLGNLGWHGNDITELDPVSGTFTLVGHKANITGHIEEYQGKQYPKVDFINDVNYSPRPPAIEDNELSKLGAKLRGKIAAYRAKEKAAPKGTAVYDEKTGKKLF